LSQRKFKDRIVEEERVEQRRAYDFNDRRRRGRMNREHVMIYMPMVVMVVVVFDVSCSCCLPAFDFFDFLCYFSLHTWNRKERHTSRE